MIRTHPLLLPSLATAALLLLAACTAVGPHYEKPSAPTPAAFTNTGPTSSADAHFNGTDWWLLFQDPELNALETKALAHNQQLAAALARIDEARARLGLAQADRSPSLSTTSTAKLAGESAERTLPVPGRPITYRDHGDSYRIPFDAAYELDLWGRVRHTIESASAQDQASQQDLAVLRLTITSELAQTWFTRRSLATERALIDQAIELRHQQIALHESRLKAGLSNALELQRQQLELASLAADRADLLRRLTQTAHALALLSGEPASTFVLHDEAKPFTPPSIPVGLPSSLLTRRPDILAAERQLAARTAEIGIARAAFFPAIRLTAAAGFESPDLGALLNHTSQFWQLGPSLSYSFLNGKRNRAQLAAAQARATAAHADYQQKVLIAFREVEDALVDLRQLAEQSTALTHTLAAADELHALTLTRHTHGLVSYLEVIETEHTQVTRTRQRTQIDAARMLATVRLIKALGGTWTDTPAIP